MTDAGEARGWQRHLGGAEATLVALGMVLSTDALKTAPVVAAHAPPGTELWLWLAGGLISLIGALCYAEMAAAFPEPGGEFAFLRRAWGQRIGALYAWSRFAVLHTGWIALMAHLLADYVAALLPLGTMGHTGFAMGVVIGLVGLNLGHVRLGFGTQAVLVAAVGLGFAVVALAGAVHHPAADLPGPPPLPGIGPALIYVFLAYGGSSDMATLSGELRGGPGQIPRVIIGAMLVLMAIYLLLNAALLHGLGRAGLVASPAPGAELALSVFGPWGAALVVAVITVAAISSINSTLIVCARVTAAAAQDHPALGFFGQWHPARAVPARATLAAGLCALGLTLVAGLATSGFAAMVDYMTPVYWLFACLGIAANIRLRLLYPDIPRPLRTPLFPLFPLAFLATGLVMLWSSLTELGPAALAGAAVLVLGLAIDTVLRRKAAAMPVSAA